MENDLFLSEFNALIKKHGVTSALTFRVIDDEVVTDVLIDDLSDRENDAEQDAVEAAIDFAQSTAILVNNVQTYLEETILRAHPLLLEAYGEDDDGNPDFAADGQQPGQVAAL